MRMPFKGRDIAMALVVVDDTREIVKELDFSLKIKRVDPGMIIHFNGRKIHRYREFEKWINELDVNFPGIDHRAIWSEIEKVGEKAWSIINETPLFPPSKAKDLLSYFNKNLPKYLDLLPFLFKSFISKMPKSVYQNKNYVQFLDQILMMAIIIFLVMAWTWAFEWKMPKKKRYYLRVHKVF